jgi:hypothetical protein
MSSVLSVSVEAVCRGVGVVCHGLLKIHEEKEKKTHSANPKQIKGRKLYKKINFQQIKIWRANCKTSKKEKMNFKRKLSKTIFQE